MELVFTLIFFILGLIVGSFLNVVILRFGTGKTFGGRSGCMVCMTTLRWYELFPLFSFLALRGRCRTCSTRISLQYPLVELTGGLVFAMLFVKFESLFYLAPVQFAFTYGYYCVLFSILLVISVYDIKHKIIPDLFSFVFGLLAFVGMFLFTPAGFVLHLPEYSNILAGFVISIPFALLWLVSGGRWMGLGDAKLAVGLGFMLGLSALLSATTLAFWLGSIVGIGLIILKRMKGIKSEVPLAPFLVIGALVVFLCEFSLFPGF